MKKLILMLPVALILACSDSAEQSSTQTTEETQVIEQSTIELEEAVENSEQEIDSIQNDVDSLLNEI